MIILYVTHENEAKAQKVVDHLLEKKLIACANFLPIRSCYRWKGKKENTNEIVTLLKTRNALWKAVEKEIKKIHPYEVPCIMKMDAKANSEYENWITKETAVVSQKKSFTGKPDFRVK
jgi:periplasmic divalent cation tolerance protein